MQSLYCELTCLQLCVYETISVCNVRKTTHYFYWALGWMSEKTQLESKQRKKCFSLLPCIRIDFGKCSVSHLLGMRSGGTGAKLKNRKEVIITLNFMFFVFGATAPPPRMGQGLLIHELSRSHTTTRHSR